MLSRGPHASAPKRDSYLALLRIEWELTNRWFAAATEARRLDDGFRAPDFLEAFRSDEGGRYTQYGRD